MKIRSPKLTVGLRLQIGHSSMAGAMLAGGAFEIRRPVNYRVVGWDPFKAITFQSVDLHVICLPIRAG
ncbi:hypothetical protein BAE36_04135 [Rhizobium leguminosarum bv. trifolii]|jgi:hypothetical protein|uniref:Uncharacterized protein n=1 Tax=Rhizobium leguminosarum bv. trifolii TaxID=386 RepID=A0A1B8RIN8_RHILT|nr:hypothetical protein [Rhizobium leguminosarum bv. trifolii]MBB4330419.1 hypothetical protein [Rhizobium leguminosarum]OOO41174.1 hypothetical protein BS629_34965 [Rhizobium leguminosarum bv. viciae USDA 2370]MBB4339716.1 hypothetical protein [Rhizobium leguminosarum]MBB4355599.1 hypothetical protein [Rhizobium leguminosarum]